MTFTLGVAGHRRRPGPLRPRVPADRRAAGPRLARLHQPRDVRRTCPTPRPAATSSRPAPSTSATAPAPPTPPRCCRPPWRTPPTRTRPRRPSPGDRTPSAPVRLRHRHLLRRDHPDPAGRHRRGRADPAQQQRAGLGLRVHRQRPARRVHGRSVGAARPHRRAAPLLRAHHRRRRQRERLVGADRVLRAAQPHPAARLDEGDRPRLLPRRRDQGVRAAARASCCPGRRSASCGCSPPTGRGHGKVRVRVGRRDWHVVDLAGRRRRAQAARRHRPLLRHAHRTDRHRVAEYQAGRPRRRRRAPQPVPGSQPQRPTLTTRRTASRVTSRLTQELRHDLFVDRCGSCDFRYTCSLSARTSLRIRLRGRVVVQSGHFIPNGRSA